MAQILRMPEIAANATHARLETWLVDEGEAVVEGQVLAEIETEKAMVELTAESDGTLHRRLVPPGTDVAVGTPIAILAAADATPDELAALVASAGATEVPAPTSPAPEPPRSQPAPEPAEESAEAPAEEPAHRRFSSPLARKRARELGVVLTEIDGSGPNGRVTVRDVMGHVDAPVAPGPPLAPAVQAPAGTGFVDIPHTPMRRAIARRLTESKTTVPHYYVSAQCRADALLEVRRQINSGPERNVSVTDLIVLATALAFVEVPEANVIWTADALRRFSTVDLALAVATDSGLVTPVLHDVTQHGILHLSTTVADVVSRARAGRLRQHELEGGSFAITNLGMYGTDSFAAILNPPQSGILAVGAARKAAVVDGDALAIAMVIDVTLSVDHRAIDGALAATWLAAFRRLVENPVRMLV